MSDKKNGNRDNQKRLGQLNNKEKVNQMTAVINKQKNAENSRLFVIRGEKNINR